MDSWTNPLLEHGLLPERVGVTRPFRICDPGVPHFEEKKGAWPFAT